MGRGPRGFPVFRGPDGVVAALGPSVVAFGKFDGVHLGHRALLDRAAAAGYRLGLPHGAATFERHPYAHLRRDRVPPVLTGLGERLRLLCEAGARFVVLFPADASVLGIPAEDFARDVLRDRMGVRLVVVGKNFHFGRGGAGDVGTLRRLTSVTGLDGVEIDMADLGGEVISSSRIREHLGRGDVARATALLGRPHGVVGRTVEAAGSSALVLVSPTRAVPAAGTYRTSVGAAPVPATWCTALVIVHPPDGGPHRLELEWQDRAAPAVGAGRAVRVAFESRA
jgi:riboflavin kinase/FMN adenylyltransferase